MPSLKILMAVAEWPPHITGLCSLMQLQLLIVMKMPFIPLVTMQFPAAKTTLVKMVPRKETCIWCSLVHTKTDQRSSRFPGNSEISPLTCFHYCLSWVSSALSTVYPSHSLAEVWIKD